MLALKLFFYYIILDQAGFVATLDQRGVGSQRIRHQYSPSSHSCLVRDSTDFRPFGEICYHAATRTAQPILIHQHQYFS